MIGLVFSLILAGLPAAETPTRPWVRVVVQAQPEEIVLGEGGAINVKVRFEGSDGQGVAVDQPEIKASAGQLIDIRPDGTGAFTATYLAPDSKTPAVDVISAVDPASGALGWMPIRLAARATIPVNVNKPNSQVTVTFAGRTVGPVKADRRGNAAVSLLVPPGRWTLTVKAVDESGNETITTQPLPVPKYRQAWVFPGPVGCAPGAVPGGWVDVVAVTASGRRAQGARPALTSGGLTFSSPLEVSPGHLRYSFVTKAGSDRSESMAALYAGSRATAKVRVGAVPDISEDAKGKAGDAEKALVETRAHIAKTFELLERARKERNLVLLRCVQDRFNKMKAIARVSERAHEALRRDLTQCRESAVLQNHGKVDMGRDKVKRLAAEAEACIGDAGALAAHTAVNVKGPDADPDDFPEIDDGDDYNPPPDASPYQ